MANPRIDQYGAVVVPPVTLSTDGGSLVATLDPTINNLLGAFKSILNSKLDATWTKAAKGLCSHVVVGTYDYEPFRPAAVLGWLWPALFMWRQKERGFLRTQFWDDCEVTGKLTYILPPLPLNELGKLQPIRVAVRSVLRGFIKHFGDPAYNSGENILRTNNLESFNFTEASYGYLPSEAEVEMYHPVLDMTWVMREREAVVSTQYTALSSISTDVYVEDENGGEGETLIVEDYFDAFE